MIVNMRFEEDIMNSIIYQVHHNSGKNLYSHAVSGNMSFCSFTEEVVARYNDELKLCWQTDLMEKIIDNTVDTVLKEFYCTNQYIDFNNESKALLKQVYNLLFQDIIVNELDLKIVQERHYTRLAKLLSITNPFTAIINPPNNTYASSAVCAEYSAEFQLFILGLKLSEIKAPLLDIGCGENAELVNFMRSAGIEAYGVDRICADKKVYLSKENWFEYDFGISKWGTIVSNIALSSHFINNNLRKDGKYSEFAMIYMKVLNGLVPGGSFIYAPAIPFIENCLQASEFLIERELLNKEYYRVKVTRLYR
ncbi:hypothetical protein SAMN05421842_11412 [Clostridium uliginosum]|uniref:Methyltransferase domain-containing protein n=2 Tax=Clostridium uliginosum TaxID=119641 RepID=A0A1I1N7K9_9CLOT|nr:hypothetical protein SAMN05421842_11412 [Clostridium uliginosum]